MAKIKELKQSLAYLEARLIHRRDKRMCTKFKFLLRFFDFELQASTGVTGQRDGRMDIRGQFLMPPLMERSILSLMFAATDMNACIPLKSDGFDN